MIINKDNKNFIGNGFLSLNGSFIKLFEFVIEDKKIILKIEKPNLEDKHMIIFNNVVCFNYKIDNFIINNEQLHEWEIIPNKYYNDNYLMETKENYLSRGIKWNDNLFALRIITTSMAEIKIICESIIFI